jgi:hypothetical protein
MLALTAPVATNLVGNLGNFTGTSDPNAINNDQLLTWNSSTSQYQTLFYFNAADAAADWSGPAGFYDSGGSFYNAAPAVGTAFFIYHVVAGTEYWTNSFSF